MSILEELKKLFTKSEFEKEFQRKREEAYKKAMLEAADKLGEQDAKKKLLVVEKKQNTFMDYINSTAKSIEQQDPLGIKKIRR